MRRVLFAALAIVAIPLTNALSGGCSKQTNFSSKSAPSAATPYAPSGESLFTPPPVDSSSKPQVCTKTHQATRMVLLVDNSGSHGGSGNATGSDPLKTALISARGITEPYTQRQAALWRAITLTADSDKTAKETNASFQGSDIGVVYFPKGNDLDGYNNSVDVSGPDGLAATALPQRMTNMTSITPGTTFSDAVWTGMSFTHTPQGATPYFTALKGARAMLDASHVEGDPRHEVIILLTDGLPTDTRPSAVVNYAKENFRDKGVLFITIFVFKTSEGQRIEDSEAYISLKNAFEKQNWGREEGFTQFNDYWSALVKIPNQISDYYVILPDASKLKDEIEKILGVAQSCQ